MSSIPDEAIPAFEDQEAFLAALVEARGDLAKARQLSGVSTATFYKWLREDEQFRTRYDQYRLHLAEEVEGEAISRVVTPAKGRGRASDALIAALLKGLKRDRYGDGQPQTGVNIVYISGLRETPRLGAVTPALPEGETGADSDARPA